MAELTVRLLTAVGGLAESPPVGSVGPCISEELHAMCFALGDVDGSGWLGSRPASVPAYSRANLHPRGDTRTVEGACQQSLGLHTTRVAAYLGSGGAGGRDGHSRA